MKRMPLAAFVAAFFICLLWFVSTRQAVLFLVGIGMGYALAGTRFGFTSGWRRLIERRDPRGVLAQLLLLGIAAALSMPLLAHYPELSAALGPPSISLLVGAFVFGLTMQIADGCGSGTLYKAGMGVPLNMAILPLFALGSFFGSVHIDRWLALGSLEPAGLVQMMGPLQAFGLTCIGLLLLAGIVMRWCGNATPWFDRRLWIGALALGLLAALNLLIAGQPWGVVYGFGLWAGKIATATGAFAPQDNWFWSQPGNFKILSQSVLLDVTTITNIGILAGALLVSARRADAQAQPQRLNGQQWMIGLLAGFLMGYSSRLAFGCNIGAMVSGISTGSLHGWIWVPMAFCGTLIGIRVRRHFNFTG